MKNRMPSTPPSSELRKNLQEVDSDFGVFRLEDVEGGKGEDGAATITPEQAPMLWIIMFCPRALFPFHSMPLRPTAMMAMGMAASNTWPTLRPR